MMPQLNPWWVAVFVFLTLITWSAGGFYLAPGLVLLGAFLFMAAGFAWSCAADWMYLRRQKQREHIE